MTAIRPFLLLAASIFCTDVQSQANAQTQSAAPSPEKEASRQASALVSKMTLDEKLTQLTHGSAAIPRLNVPAYNWWTEALHGLVSDVKTTDFPEPIGLAASFDESLLHQVANTISLEVRANYKLKSAAGDTSRLMTGRDVWSPNLNIYRDPRWGRGQETYGEDPYLTGRLGVAYITGMQGADTSHPDVIATPKHFAVHSGPESTRHEANVDVSAHDLEDTYLPAFRAAIVEGRAGSIMCAYNAINGQPACANDFLLKATLRKAWGFNGYVVSDCGAIADIADGHKFAPTREAAIGSAFQAGVDNECGFNNSVETYRRAFDQGDLSVQVVDQALLRLFTARYRLGIMPDRLQPPNPEREPGIGGEVANVATPEAEALARRAAEESLVLLKNNGVLPVASTPVKIAVIGPLADKTRVLRGNYSSDRSSPPVSVWAGLKAALPQADFRLVRSGPFAGDAEVVPQSALRTPDGHPGLKLELYSAAESKGGGPTVLPKAQLAPSAILLSTSVAANVDLDAVDAIRNLPPAFEAVWTGSLVAPETGLYQLGLKGVVGYLEFDGAPLLTVEGFPPGPPSFKTVHLESGHAYPLRIVGQITVMPSMQLVWNRVSEAPDAEVLDATRTADLVVAVVGLSSELEGEESKADLPGFHGGDRTSLDLPADQQQMLQIAKASGKPLVVVVMNGGAINLRWAKENADALIEAWYPGEQGGSAVGRAISGAINPAGRLPITFYESVADLPPFENYSMTGRTYRYFTGTPVYPFGFGLSYTKFSYGKIKIDRTGRSFQLKVDVTNTGLREGDEVAQLYLRFPKLKGAPRIALRGFKRLHLQVGEKRNVTFTLSPRDLSAVRADGLRVVARGRYFISVGGGQPSTTAQFTEASLSISHESPLQR